MAMTKAEQKRVDDLQHEVKLLLALRWPTDFVPVPMTREEIIDARKDGRGIAGEVAWGSDEKIVVQGWFANPHSVRVTLGCTDGHHHCPEGLKLRSRDSGVMYHTEAEAWRVIRHVKVREFAEVLARIDAEIARSEGEKS